MVEDKLTCVGDLAMDRRIANMDDGSYLGTLKAYASLSNARPAASGCPVMASRAPVCCNGTGNCSRGSTVHANRRSRDGLPLEEAKALVLRDPRVASRARETKGFRHEYRQVRQPGLPGGRGGQFLNFPITDQ